MKIMDVLAKFQKMSGFQILQSYCINCHQYKQCSILYIDCIVDVIPFRLTTYVDQRSAWYEQKTKQEIVNIKIFEKLEVGLNLFFGSTLWGMVPEKPTKVYN